MPTHLERHAAHVRSEGYQKRQVNMASWQNRQADIAWLENADKTEAERLADYKATPVYQAREQESVGMREYLVRMEEKIKAHYRRSLDDQPPPDAVIIPPLTAEQHAALKNWNTATQVATYGATTLVGALSVFIATKNPWLGIIGAAAGAMWGAYEVSCIASVQDEFNEAYRQGSGVTVWREGWKFNVDASSSDGSYTQANGPLSALYVAATTLIMTGKIP